MGAKLPYLVTVHRKRSVQRFTWLDVTRCALRDSNPQPSDPKYDTPPFHHNSHSYVFINLDRFLGGFGFYSFTAFQVRGSTFGAT